MSDFSNTLENAIINHFFRNSTNGPFTAYVRLYTAITDAEAGTGTEVGGGIGYSAQLVSFGAPSNGVASNSGTINFGTASSNWGTVTHFGLWSAATAGSHLASLKAVTTSRTINTGDSAQFSAGALTLTVT